MDRATLTQFTCLEARNKEFPDLKSTNYAASVQKLRDEFTSRFPEFRRDEIKVKLLAHPLDLAMEDCPVDCQMELFELQADMDTKRGYSEHCLVDIYRLYVRGKFPNLSRHERKTISLFGNTYCSEQFLKK